MVDDPDPQTKWVTSTIVRRTQVTFELEQEPVTKVVERQLSSIEVQYRLVRRDEWVPQAINGAPTGYWWSTNIPGGPTNGLGGRILMLTNFYYRERQPDGPSYGSPNDGLTNIPIQGWITNK
jgi:hypothetical protein